MRDECTIKRQGLYDPSLEHDACGIGAVVHIKGTKSHKVVSDALTIVERLEHRAGKDARGEIGDGVGILMQLPHSFFQKQCSHMQLEKQFGVGMFFFPQEELECRKAKKMFEIVVEQEGLKFLGWRQVPVHTEVLGSRALDSLPQIWQGFVQREDTMKSDLEFDRRLYVIRRIFEKSNAQTYVCSLSGRTIVYKGMFLVHQLRAFYKDLQDSDFISAIALVHSRFSTNTFPSWRRAHPNRMIVHNGEINTIRGNANKMLSREELLQCSTLANDMKKITPVIDPNGSDSAMLDNTLEFLMMAGVDLPKAVMLCIPEPFEHDMQMEERKKAFYQYYACGMEPWDGPASILFSDGDVVGAVLDRNGLRPSRYYITKDDTLILSSEVGVLDIQPERVVKKDRLRPGKMLLVDTRKGRLIGDEELKLHYASEHPYSTWLKNQLLHMKDIRVPEKMPVAYAGSQLTRLQKAFHYTYEDLMKYILVLARDGIEPVIAMGNDTPLAVLSTQVHPLFDYFKQLFAQVTNPPIDALREEIVTSTSVYLGSEGNLLKPEEGNCRLLKIRNPILSKQDLLKIKCMDEEGFKVRVLPITYYKNIALKEAIEHLFTDSDKAINESCNILILSDRGIDENHVAIPSLLAVSAMQQHLIRTKKRMHVAIILESGEPREVHHFATLLGYGASAVSPYIAQDSIQELIDQGLLQKQYEDAVEDYNNGILHGIVKIASKMGISTMQSYQGAQIFEAIGIASSVIDEYFTNTISRIGGITLQDIEQAVIQHHSKAFDPLGLATDTTLDVQGVHQLRTGKEQHLYHPKSIALLQSATREGSYATFKEYTRLICEELAPTHIRGLWKLDYTQRKPIALDAVESVDSIVKRFKTGAMSYGSISKEAHETLAIAMNMLHGKSNTGEGGEDAERFVVKDGINRCSAIKQVASGRFGVTSAYLNHAVEIQIKMAQGAKPGEGGQLPAGKVYPWIAKTRHSTPGVQLISPPPHHDIYSIEDLAQLIYDLKCANKDARISVKLVSEAGVGTVAAGVAKAGADVILISGHDGGTGAAPRNSVYHAGLPWELGLAETHQTLQLNELREQVILETDGKLMCGRDVIIAALLGAQEYGFATAPLITMGCVMMRVCNLDTWPVGVATQNPQLRKCFRGKPEYVVNFMRFIAQEMREYMAALGFSSVAEMVGHRELIQVQDTPLAAKLDFNSILSTPLTEHTDVAKTVFDPKATKDEAVIWKEMQPYVEQGIPHTMQVAVDNQDRAFATLFGSRITRSQHAVPADTYRILANGSAGQSFGAFLPKGITVALTGDANDYLGKGLSGGTLSVQVPKNSPFQPDENIIIGNVALYGATSGKAYISGMAGERFAVRNSGACAVVEGVGDHALEYMTGGCVVILGSFGKNLAAGMSGGVAYVLDEHKCLYDCLNTELVEVSALQQDADIQQVKSMLEQHVQHTGSSKAQRILNGFAEWKPLFYKIIPHDYRIMVETIRKYQSDGLSKDEAELKAFHAVCR